MKVPYLLIAVFALLLQDAPSDGQRWWSHIGYLASDRLEGREVGTPGFEKAAAYVESQFTNIGLKPGGLSGFRQPVKLESRVIVPERSSLAIVRDGLEEPLAIGVDAVLSARGELEGSIEAPMVFIGYGLSIPEANWDDLAGVDLRGKIAVYVNAPAPVDVADSVRSHVSSSAERWAVLKKAGAIGVATYPIARSGAGQPARATPSSVAAALSRAQAPQPSIVLADPELREFGGQMIAMGIARAGASKFFAGCGHTLEELDRLIADGKPLPRFPLAGSLRARATVERNTIESANLIGILEGTDPQLKDEYVVMSAHLDHVGIGRPVNGDSIYNGAMDDASGVATVIELARMMAGSGAKPKRSVAFVTVTAEEKGLLGSKYFAARPTIPFDRIVADVNLDMFLPLYPLRVIEVQGLTESTLGDTVRAAAKAVGVDVQTDREPEQNRFIRSDQYSFIRSGIPSLAFKFGYEYGSPEEKIRREWVRTVYHQPNDDLSQPVDLEAAATFNRVILGLLQRVANDPARPSWKADSFFRRFAR